MSRPRARPRRRKIALLHLLAATILSLSCSAKRRAAEVDFPKEPPGLVVSSHPEGSRAGLQVLRQGGNAVDAAVATGLALGVVDQFNSGIGGGGFVLIRLSDGTVYAIDGREKAPASASRDMYIRDGSYDPALSKVGPLAVGVPGILAAYEKALELAGSRSLGELVEPAVSLAENGSVLDSYALSRYERALEALGQDPPSALIYFRDDGSPFKEGDLLVQPDLAETYRKIGSEGSAYFYRGDFARRLAAFMEEKGGLVTLADMSNYRAVVRKPVVGTYRDYTVFGMPPPSSGGVHVVQILNMLEVSGILHGRSAWDPYTVLWTSRFMCRAFEDRAAYLGDSDFIPVPVDRLTSKTYAEEIVAGMMKRKAAPAVVYDSHGAARPEGGHTTSFVVLDRAGNVVAVNQTVNLNYGAKTTLPGTGVILNNEMDDFSAQPGTPNAFGLVGSEANAIEPGKRPLSSMSPTIVVKGEKPVMALGGAGGPTIITAVLQVIVNVIDLGMDLPQAMSSPRFHHQYLPDVLIVEKDSSLVRELEETGEGVQIVTNDHIGVVNAIAWSEKARAYVGVSDPRARESSAWLQLPEERP
ncbi:MAG: gamma-glutamyltransferase [Thermodesulfobacteriota bacterium]